MQVCTEGSISGCDAHSRGSRNWDALDKEDKITSRCWNMVGGTCNQPKSQTDTQNVKIKMTFEETRLDVFFAPEICTLAPSF